MKALQCLYFGNTVPSKISSKNNPRCKENYPDFFFFQFQFSKSFSTFKRRVSKMNENEVPELIENYNNPMNGSDSDDEEFDAEEELMDFCQDPCKDLFSDEFFKTPSECLKHCKSQYDFDLLVRE